MWIKWLVLIGCQLLAFAVYAQEIGTESASKKFSEASRLFSQGKFKATIDELKKSEFDPGFKNDLGLIYYWKGVSHSRLQEYPEAIESFDRALGKGFKADDLPYEYGQVLFAAEKLPEARVQFHQSFKRNYKRAVCLYYLGYISRELGEEKKALSFFKVLEKLPENERAEVWQPAEVQVGDMFLEQVEMHPDAFRSVQKHVIPQYQRALKIDPKSELAGTIRQKIIDLEKKYELAVFQMRNGRVTPYPPYFLRLAQEISYDSNVTFAPQETTTASSDQKSWYSKTDFIGRYTFFHKGTWSFAPEIRANKTYHFNRVPEIYRNDNQLLAPAVRMAYEHSWFKKPASVLFDLDYSYVERDINSKKKLEFASRSYSVMLGERFNYFDFGETILRFRRRTFQSYADSSNSTTNSFVFEQIRMFKEYILIFYSSYDMTRVNSEAFDTNSLTLSGDLILPRIKDWFTPSIGLGITRTDPFNDRSNRGIETLINPRVRVSKTFGGNWRINAKYDYQKNNSRDKANFAFKKNVYGFELEYLF